MAGRACSGPRLRRCRAGDEAGATLVELLIVLVLITLVGAMVSSSVITALQAGRRGQDRVYALTDLEFAAQRVSREIRAADPISDAESDSIRLTIYRDGGRSIYEYFVGADANGVPALIEDVVVYPDETTTVASSTYERAVIRDIDQTGVSTFTYRKADGSLWDSGADALSDIAQVEIVLVRALREQGPIQVETSVYVRNSS